MSTGDTEKRTSNERWYDHKTIEAKWSERWYKDNLYRAEDFSQKPKRFILVEFPYPSGTGLHCGHAYRFTMPDAYARKLRMSGYNVLFPIGWDAFGLPAENYAVQTGVHPAETTSKAIDTYRKQTRMMGYSFDWEREVNTTDPGYYKWTQWIFLKLFEAGLAELREQPVWWCEALKTVLANEEVLEDDNGKKISERGSHPVEKRMLKQWILKMPAYADKLLAGLDEIDFPESIRIAQSTWIGRSQGATLRFPLSEPEKTLDVFTTRPDTILGVTFMVIAPEHPLITELKSKIRNVKEVEQYCTQAANRSDLERKAAKEKTGVLLDGITATNPLDPSGPPIPIFVADYVLMDYGTGAIMAVPAHDARDFEFAKRFDVSIEPTVSETPGMPPTELPFVSEKGFLLIDSARRATLEKILNRPIASHVPADEWWNTVVDYLHDHGKAERKITYKIRDWLFSRQRYWGEPIPLVHCEDGTIEAVTATDDAAGVKAKLPLILPQVPDYRPSSDGTSPLARNKEWLCTKDSQGRPAIRETNTMPNWAGSCWYYMRYCDPKNDECFADPKKMQYWLPVDKYFGGSEHTTLHLLYSRFWHRFLYDQGLVPTSEPYAWRMNGGLLLGPDNQKMSKSIGNVISPDDKVERYGADALRLYINFMGPYDATLPWSENGLKACRKLLDRIYDLREKVSDTPNAEDLLRSYNKLVKKVGSMLESLKSNTAVSEIMIFVRAMEAAPHIHRDIWKGFLKVLAPLAVFSAEELWHQAHGWTEWSKEHSVHLQSWPTFDEKFAQDEIVKIGIQINGKVRDELEVGITETEDSVRVRALDLEGVKKWVGDKQIRKFVYVPGRIVNLVVG